MFRKLSLVIIIILPLVLLTGLQAGAQNPENMLVLFTDPVGDQGEWNPAGQSIRIEVTGANGGTPEAASGMLHYDTGSGFVSVPMQVVSATEYDAVFPAIDCGLQVKYYLVFVNQD